MLKWNTITWTPLWRSSRGSIHDLSSKKTQSGKRGVGVGKVKPNSPLTTTTTTTKTKTTIIIIISSSYWMGYLPQVNEWSHSYLPRAGGEWCPHTARHTPHTRAHTRAHTRTPQMDPRHQMTTCIVHQISFLMLPCAHSTLPASLS